MVVKSDIINEEKDLPVADTATASGTTVSTRNGTLRLGDTRVLLRSKTWDALDLATAV